jgi:hypothetical protein
MRGRCRLAALAPSVDAVWQHLSPAQEHQHLVYPPVLLPERLVAVKITTAAPSAAARLMDSTRNALLTDGRDYR